MTDAAVGRVVTTGLSVFTSVLTRIIGGEVLQDLSQFIAALETMFGGFRERAQATYDLLTAPGTTFVVVAAPERDALLEYIADRRGRIAASLHRALQARAQHLDHLARRLVRPGERLRQQRQHLTQLALRLSGARKRFSESHGWQLQRLAERLQASVAPFNALNEAVNRLVARHRFALTQALARRAEQLNRMNGNLQHLNPARVLERGYSVVRNRAGNVVTDSAQISIAEQIDVAFARGTADVRVTHIKTK